MLRSLMKASFIGLDDDAIGDAGGARKLMQAI
jgi:hypothetical protein